MPRRYYNKDASTGPGIVFMIVLAIMLFNAIQPYIVLILILIGIIAAIAVLIKLVPWMVRGIQHYRKELPPKIGKSGREILAIEQAQSSSERLLLMAREFCRIGGDILQSGPMTSEKRMSIRYVNQLVAESSVLEDAASDTSITYLPAGNFRFGMTQGDIRSAIHDLSTYLIEYRNILLNPYGDRDLNALRMLARDYNRLRITYQRVFDAITNE